MGLFTPFSLRNLISYRVIGSTIAGKVGEHVLDLEFVMNSIKISSSSISSGNLHCISCITYEFMSTVILVYAISIHISGEDNTIKRLENVEYFSKLRRFVEKTVWIILFVLTKHVENAI
jgi:hypothetical protein